MKIRCEAIKNNKKVVFTYVKLTNLLSFSTRFPKSGPTYRGGKWLIHGTRHRKDNQLQSLELLEYPSRECKHDIKESKRNMFNPIFKEYILFFKFRIAVNSQMITRQINTYLAVIYHPTNGKWILACSDYRHFLLQVMPLYWLHMFKVKSPIVHLRQYHDQVKVNTCALPFMH